jgi:hypothetical protein
VILGALPDKGVGKISPAIGLSSKREKIIAS